MPNSKETAVLTQAGLNLIQQALSIYDRKLQLVIGNRQFQDMFDLPDKLVRPGAEFGDTIRHLAERGDYGGVGDIDAFVRSRVDQAKAFVPHYIERTRANGRVISVEGNPLSQGGWVTVYTDITHIKRQERLLRARSEELSDLVFSHTEELAQTNRALESTNKALEEAKRELTEMERSTRLTAEMMPAHIARIDQELTYTFSNRRLGKVIPGRPADLFGLHAKDALGDEAYARISPYFQKAFTGEASVFEFTHEGSGRRIRVALTPDCDEVSDDITGIYILSMDITEEAQARAALGQTRKRELAAQLTSGVAHDFSNLLTIILGLQSRLAKMQIDETAHELVQATRAAVRRGGKLLERIASISGKRELHYEPTDISDLLRGLETLTASTLPKGVNLNIKVSGLENPVILDAGAVQEGLLNLIINASHAIGVGPGQITISVRPIRETWIEFRVTDTGPGFSQEALEHALDPFFTTKGGEGSGLGLSMVYDQTTVSGGHVKIFNASPTGGAVVSIRLPLRKPARPIAPRLVLLIEDSTEIRASVREMLTDMGHQVIEAASTEEALGLVALDGIGLILSDIILEGAQTGPEFLLGLKDAGVEIPMVLMTSLPSNDPRRAKAGFPVLHKPFTKGELATFLSQEVRT